ncbi:hypothetical protein FA341_31700 [Pseudomonas aeruginosa]|uniref:hypothetical protein n=1 Tax=Pseudomonas aeruginosa group TaxID=136841 RepID=UPI000CFBAD5E|nr:MULTISPECIES: hypothetical protein [Pseudomonas aeruginosa group]EIU2642999.1 hypothetical protein [Pseudomonas aeruginosa]EIU9551290.1 hypothetical protein [Pseudomonas aeruginosa]EJY6032815.1 hypothetical protein [Pseudomonas aeruginosa]EKC7897118.1 hypothetical protein [Pseudomonas aeruginosa]EKM9120049.1 hypothetical protein [Pseudomonas aeruginosa]
MTELSQEHPCAACGKPAVKFGKFCAACYGGVLQPKGLPLTPGDPNDPYREFNAEADAYVFDQKMPPPESVWVTIQMIALRRRRRGDDNYED